MKKYGNDTLFYIDYMNEFFDMFNSVLDEVENEERESYDTPIMVIDLVREKLKEKEHEICKELTKELSADIRYLNFQQTMKNFEGVLNMECANCGVQPAYKTLL